MITLREMLIDTNLLKSPIANYVFFYYAKVKKEMVFGVRDEAGNYTLNGVESVVNVWNDMSEMSYEVYEFLTASSSTYPEFKETFKLGYINTVGI